MRLIVQKFGGTSVKNKERIFNVANIITNAYKNGNNIIAVVSAQGDTTDDLLEKANVVGTPGSGFGPSGEGYFRLTAFGTYENTLAALERIKAL